MNVMNEHEIEVTLDQLEKLVTEIKNSGANPDDKIYLTDLGRRGVFATHAHRGDEYHYDDTMTYYRNYRGKGFYKCHDCRDCVYSEVNWFNVMCLRDVDEGYDPMNVGIVNEELLEACDCFVRG